MKSKDGIGHDINTYPELDAYIQFSAKGIRRIADKYNHTLEEAMELYAEAIKDTLGRSE